MCRDSKKCYDTQKNMLENLRHYVLRCLRLRDPTAVFPLSLPFFLSLSFSPALPVFAKISCTFVGVEAFWAASGKTN